MRLMTSLGTTSGVLPGWYFRSIVASRSACHRTGVSASIGLMKA